VQGVAIGIVVHSRDLDCIYKLRLLVSMAYTRIPVVVASWSVSPDSLIELVIKSQVKHSEKHRY
jgi:hypothetical protein